MTVSVPYLRLVGETSERALPRFWDGKPVVWRGWHPAIVTSLTFRHKIKCPRCRAHRSGNDQMCQGMLSPIKQEYDAFVERYRVWETKQGFRVRSEPPGWFVLTAFRCAFCDADEVMEWDGRDFKLWDLGPEDYGPQGSYVLGQGVLL